MRLDESKLQAMLSVAENLKVDVVSSDSGYSVCVTDSDGKAHTLRSQRTDRRIWKNLDTLHNYLRNLGVGSYSVI